MGIARGVLLGTAFYRTVRSGWRAITEVLAMTQMCRTVITKADHLADRVDGAAA